MTRHRQACPQACMQRGGYYSDLVSMITCVSLKCFMAKQNLHHFFFHFPRLPAFWLKATSLSNNIDFPGGSVIKKPPARWVWSMIQQDPLEKKMATYSRILAWRIPLTEESTFHEVAKSWTWLTKKQSFLPTHLSHTHTHLSYWVKLCLTANFRTESDKIREVQTSLCLSSLGCFFQCPNYSLLWKMENEN